MRKRTLLTVLTLLSLLGMLVCHHAVLQGFPEEKRVEVLCTGDPERVKAILAENAVAAWESDRFVIKDANLFTAQMLESSLLQGGLSHQQVAVLDYSWASDVLAQSEKLWLAGTVILLVLQTVRMIWYQIRKEVGRMKNALFRLYLGEYFSDSGVRLLVKAIFGAILVLTVLLLLRWLLAVPIRLPAALLPPDSLFDADHYRRWVASTFPAECLSDYGATLLHLLKVGYGLAGVECVVMTLFVLAYKKETID